MTSLLHFEDKVHRKRLARAKSLPLLMPRLLCQVLEHLGFPEEPQIEMRVRCPQVLSMERAMVMPISFILQQQDQEEVPVPEAKHSHRDDSHALEPEVKRSPAPHISLPSPDPHATSIATADTPGPSYTSHHSPEYVHASSREIAGVLDAICSLAATQATQDQRLCEGPPLGPLRRRVPPITVGPHPGSQYLAPALALGSPVLAPQGHPTSGYLVKSPLTISFASVRVRSCELRRYNHPRHTLITN